MFDKFAEARKIAKEFIKAHSLSGTVTEISIGILVLAVILGTIAFPIFFGTNTTGWGSTNILIWGVVPTVALAVVIIGLVNHFKRGGNAE